MTDVQHLEPAQPAPHSADLNALSAREREVLILVADGLSNAAIAGRLNLSDHTIKRHVANILLKLNLPTRAAAAALMGRSRTGHTKLVLLGEARLVLPALTVIPATAHSEDTMDAKTNAITGAALKRAIETRDGRALTNFYADDAVLQIVDRNNPPSKPREVKGKIQSVYSGTTSAAGR